MGDGSEARLIRDHFRNSYVVAIDIVPWLRSYKQEKRLRYINMDARDMGFIDGEFDFIYSYHTLEHIVNDVKALREMKRVLADSGCYYIGVPNKQRMVSYFNTGTLRQAFVWNFRDWKDKALGHFRNEVGAHAGYTDRELSERCNIIGKNVDITIDYYLAKYPGHQNALRYLYKMGAWRYVFQSLYVFGWKSN